MARRDSTRIESDPRPSHRRGTLLGIAVALLSLAADACAQSSATSTSRPSVVDERQREDALFEAAGPGFRIQRTAHFLIAYNAPPGALEPFLSRIESIYGSIERFCKYHDIAPDLSPPPLEIIYFATYDGYRQFARRNGFAPDGTYGFYNEDTNRAAFFDVSTDPNLIKLRTDLDEARQNVNVLERQVGRTGPRDEPLAFRFADGTRRVLTRQQAQRELAGTRKQIKQLGDKTDDYVERINRTVVQHETAHQVFFNAGVHVRGGTNPAWLVEGLAALFETPPTGAGAGHAVVNQLRLRDFRLAVTREATPSRRAIPPDAVFRAMNEGRLVPLKELITRPGLFADRGQTGAFRYAQAWALVHYLHRFKTKEFGAYLKRVASRPADANPTAEQALAEFEESFGPLDDDFIRRWAKTILSIPAASE